MSSAQEAGAGARAERWTMGGKYRGDRETLEQALRAAQGEGKRLRLAFRIAREARQGGRFEKAVSEAEALAGERAAVATSARAPVPETAVNRVFLSRFLPHGTAEVTPRFWDALLRTGVIEEFSLEPDIHLTGAPPSAAGGGGREVVFPESVSTEERQALRAAGIVSALDLCSKCRLPRGRERLARAAGLSPARIEAIERACLNILSEADRKLVEHPPPFPFVPGFRKHEPPAGKTK